MIILVLFIAAVAVSFYLYAMPSHRAALKSDDGRWITQWDQLDITEVRREFQPCFQNNGEFAQYQLHHQDFDRIR